MDELTRGLRCMFVMFDFGVRAVSEAGERPRSPVDSSSEDEQTVCEVCHSTQDPAKILLCDNCDGEYHTYCLSPPLLGIPEGDWYCPQCAPKYTAAPGADSAD